MMNNIAFVFAHFLQLTMNVKAFQRISSVIQKTLGARLHENYYFIHV